MSETPQSEGQKGAEANVDDFRQHLGPFVVATEKTRMPMVFTNAREHGHPVIFANNSFLCLTGYERDEVLGKSFRSLMSLGADPETLARIEAEFESSTDRDLEICYRRKDASVFWASIFISPVRDETGKVVQHFASFADLTKRKREQHRCKMLIDELNHRVKNTLSTVQSIVRQAFRNSSEAKVVHEAIESRLFALSRSHDLLTRENWEGAGLLDLVNDALEPYAIAGGRAERLAVAGQNIRLSPRVSLALAIAFSELATNALKYGAFSNETGTVEIGWRIKPQPSGQRLVMVWKERGGPPVAPPSRKGFGSRVIELGLAHELGGMVHLDYRSEGLVCTIDIPAP